MLFRSCKVVRLLLLPPARRLLTRALWYNSRWSFGRQPLPLAAREAVLEDLPALGGSGGCVALGADGVLVAPFTTAGMYRGWVTRDGEITVRIHGDERR